MRNLTSVPCNAKDTIRTFTRLRGRRLRLVAALAGLVAATDLAWGADLSPPGLAPVPYTWTGLYIGGNAGYAGTDVSETVSGGNGGASTNIPGFIGGGQIGANYQVGSIVLGVEADFDGSTATKSTTVGALITGSEQMPWLATARGRLGVAFGRFLVYGTAGGAATALVSNVNAGAIGSSTTTSTHGAWTAGGGLEFAISESLSARLEYLYLDTGTINIGYVGPLVVTGRVQQDMVRAGLNYRLPVAW